MKLFGYFRSSAAYRVRIALNLKGIAHEQVFVHLRRDGGQHRLPAYAALNPQGLVPTLLLEKEGGEDAPLIQSLAILENLEETRPRPPLLPADPLGRARVRSLALAVACDIHPLQNLRVLDHVTDALGHGEAERPRWAARWIETGFAAIETLLAARPENQPDAE